MTRVGPTDHIVAEPIPQAKEDLFAEPRGSDRPAEVPALRAISSPEFYS